MTANPECPSKLPVFPLLAAAFFALLLVLFADFVFDDSRLMLNSDQLNAIGTRYLRVQNLNLTEWDDSRLGGIPTLDALYGDAYHPLVLVQFVMDPARAVGFKFILTVWIAFMSAFMLARFLTERWQWGALLGFLYAFNPQFFTHIYGGHDGKMMVFAIAPFAMYALVRILREGSLAHTAYFALSVVWMVLTSHLQLTYFFLWGAGLFTLFEALRQPLSAKTRVIRIGLAGLALTLGLMISSFQLIPPYLYTTQQSVRGSGEKTTMGHAVSWSLHQEELASMLIPGFIGVDVHATEPGPTDNRYWGHNAFKLNADSAGALLTVLAFLSFFVPGQRRQATFWFLGCAVALSFALGAHSPLFSLWYAVLPGVKNFRAPSMAIFWIPLAMVFMASIVLRAIDSMDRKALQKALLLFSLLVVLVLVSRFAWDLFIGPIGALAILSFGGLFINQLYALDPATQLSRARRVEQGLLFLPFVLIASILLSGEKLLLNPDFAAYFKTLDRDTMAQLNSTIFPGFLLALGAAVGARLLLVSTLSTTQKSLLLVLIAAVELFFVNHAFVQNVPRAQYYQPEHPVLSAIRQDSPDSLQRPRILSLTRQPALKDNIFPAYGLRNALGFHDNELASYRAFRGGQGSENYLTNPQNNAFLNLERIGYILFDGPQGLQILRNPAAFAPATLYYNWSVSAQEASIAKLKDPTFDYRKILLLEKVPAGISANAQGNEALQGQARLVAERSMDTQVFEVQSPRPAMLLVSGNYHPYWRGQVNGQPAEVVCAFGTLRAIAVPAGKSHVELSYRSQAFHQCLWLLALGGLLLIILAAAAIWQKRRKIVL